MVGGSLISLSDFRGLSNSKDRMLFLKKMEDPEHAQKIYKAIEAKIDNQIRP